MYHRKYFCKHSANAQQYVSGKRGVVAAGIGNVKGSSTLRLPLRLDYNCGQRIEFYKVDVRITRAHKRTGTSTIRADGGVGGSNYQLNLLADQSRGLNSLQNATGCGKLNNFGLHFL